MHPIPNIPIPFYTLHIDHLGLFIKTKTGNTQVLVIVDAFTKFTLIYANKSTLTKYVINSLRNMIKHFGAPKRIINSFEHFSKELGIKHHLNAVGLPRGNGQVERQRVGCQRVYRSNTERSTHGHASVRLEHWQCRRGGAGRHRSSTPNAEPASQRSMQSVIRLSRRSGSTDVDAGPLLMQKAIWC